MSSPLSDVEIQSLFADNGPVEELELDEELQQHLIERGITEKHIVSFVEILEVLQGAPRFFENLPGRRAPISMVGPTNLNRILCVPIEPTGKTGVWRPVTAFTANAHHIDRYSTEVGNEQQK